MPTNIEEALNTLKGVENNQRIEPSRRWQYFNSHNASQKNKEEAKKGKWGRVAEEDLLRDGLGDELRKHVQQFRQNFTMRNPLFSKG